MLHTENTKDWKNHKNHKIGKMFYYGFAADGNMLHTENTKDYSKWAGKPNQLFLVREFISLGVAAYKSIATACLTLHSNHGLLAPCSPHAFRCHSVLSCGQLLVVFIVSLLSLVSPSLVLLLWVLLWSEKLKLGRSYIATCIKHVLYVLLYQEGGCALYIRAFIQKKYIHKRKGWQTHLDILGKQTSIQSYIFKCQKDQKDQHPSTFGS